MFIGRPESGHISKEKRERLFKKQNGRCMYCGRKSTMHYLDADHKTPVKNGGGDNIGNLQLLCKPCNGRKGSSTDGVFRKDYKLTPSRQAKFPPEKLIPQKHFDKIRDERQARLAKRHRNSEARGLYY